MTCMFNDEGHSLPAVQQSGFLFFPFLLLKINNKIYTVE